MFCTKCGEKLSKDTKFCPKCGAKIVEETQNEKSKEKVAEKIETSTTVTTTKNGNDSTKTGSIVLGIISILTCCTCFIPIILGIVGIMLAVKARKEDPTFKAGLILNIIGIVLVIVVSILAFAGILMIGLNIEGKLTHDWCCSDTLNTNKCEIQLELEDDYTFELKDNYEVFESNGTWDYEWIDKTKATGNQYTLTLNGYDYTAYVKDHDMKLYDDTESSTPIMYCTRK